MDPTTIIILIVGIAGGMLCGFLLIVLTIYLLFRYFVGRMFKGFTDMAEQLTKGIVPFTQPLRINLAQELNPEWNDTDAIKRVVKPLKKAGFEDVGVFVIDEVPDITLHALVHAANGVYAVIYEHPDKGVWYELVTRYEDGSSFSSSTLAETGVDRPTTSVVKRYEASTDVAKMYEDHLTDRPDGERSAVSIEAFRKDFERAYAEEMDWRFERGGFTEEEVRRTLKITDEDTTDQQVKQVHAMQQAQVNVWLQVKLQENFRAKSGMSGAKWRKIEGRVVFVHDRLTSEEIHGMFSMNIDWDEDDAQEISEKAEKIAQHGTARETFGQMIQLLPTKRVPQKLGHLTKPIAADVYLISLDAYTSGDGDV